MEKDVDLTDRGLGQKKTAAMAVILHSGRLIEKKIWFRVVNVSDVFFNRPPLE